MTATNIRGQKVFLPATRQPILYKYFAPPAGSETYAEANLENLLIQNQVRLSSNAEVNDPADMSPYIDHDHTQQDVENYFKRMINTPFDDPDAEAQRLELRKQTVNRAGRKIYARDHGQTHARVAIDAAQRNFLGTGFTCMTEEWSNRLMWSHYGQSHKGICVGFRTRPNIGEAVLPFAANFLEVKYISDRPVWSIKAMMSGNQQADVITQTFFRKDKVWEYEKEWRYTSPIDDGAKISNGGDIIKIGSNEIVEIVFGMRVSKKSRISITDMISRSGKSPLMYDTKFAEKSFELVRTLNR